MKKLKCILYVNQFFAQVGGEEMADYEPEIREGVVGPGIAYQSCFGDAAEITHTIICGDNYMGSHTSDAINKIMELIGDKEIDIFFAGPAFRAGRYGVASGTICKAIKEKYNIPVYSSMNEENPGVEMFRHDMIIFSGGKSAADMKKDVTKMVSYALRKASGEEMLWASEEGYFGRGIRHQVFLKEPVQAADRAVDMLLARLYDKPFVTELPMIASEMITPAKAIKDISKSRIVLITSGGIVPPDNPDKIQSASATRWGKYNIEGLDSLKSGEYKTVHAGFDPTEADKNPNVVAPLDALRQYENEKTIGELYNYFYSTVGTGTTQSEASRMANEIADELIKADIDGAIMVST